MTIGLQTYVSKPSMGRLGTIFQFLRQWCFMFFSVNHPRRHFALWYFTVIVSILNPEHNNISWFGLSSSVDFGFFRLPRNSQESWWWHWEKIGRRYWYWYIYKSWKKLSYTMVLSITPFFGCALLACHVGRGRSPSVSEVGQNTDLPNFS